jgi:flavin reductase (DIM6/NTAB) family NADH-FMN oxidoreductase RutF
MMKAQGDPMTLDPETLRRAMRQWATGVTVVTAQLAGRRHGMTVNAFTSVSLEPPLVLVSLERATRTHGLVERSGVFGITILGEDQLGISERFAGRVSDLSDRFAGLETDTLVSGVPFIRGGLAYLDCRVVERHPAGTHTLFIGEVMAAQSDGEGSPLLYLNREYRKLRQGEVSHGRKAD